MGSRIAVMKDGRIQQVGTPLDIYDRPENLFVANFIGTPPMNFLRATVGDAGASIAASGFTLPVPERLRPETAAYAGKPIVVGVRPEHIVDASATIRGAASRLSGDVEVVEPLGDEAIVHARVGRELLIFKVEPHRMPEVGERLDIALELDRIHLFDPETESRLDRGLQKER